MRFVLCVLELLLRCKCDLGSSGILTLRLLMSYIYGAPILDVSRSHTRRSTLGRTPLDE